MMLVFLHPLLRHRKEEYPPLLLENPFLAIGCHSGRTQKFWIRPYNYISKLRRPLRYTQLNRQVELCVIFSEKWKNVNPEMWTTIVGFCDQS